MAVDEQLNGADAGLFQQWAVLPADVRQDVQLWILDVEAQRVAALDGELHADALDDDGVVENE